MKNSGEKPPTFNNTDFRTIKSAPIIDATGMGLPSLLKYTDRGKDKQIGEIYKIDRNSHIKEGKLLLKEVVGSPRSSYRFPPQAPTSGCSIKYAYNLSIASFLNMVSGFKNKIQSPDAYVMP
jgi:hypothetical protein